MVFLILPISPSHSPSLSVQTPYKTVFIQDWVVNPSSCNGESPEPPVCEGETYEEALDLCYIFSYPDSKSLVICTNYTVTCICRGSMYKTSLILYLRMVAHASTVMRQFTLKYQVCVSVLTPLKDASSLDFPPAFRFWDLSFKIIFVILVGLMYRTE